MSTGAFLPAGTPIDLSNCEREPIHIPGSIQPRGVLLGLIEPELRITWISASVSQHLGLEPAQVLGQGLAAAIGPRAASVIARHLVAFGDLRDRNPVDVTSGSGVRFDAILHRLEGGLVILELEAADGPRPFSYPNTYQSVRSAVTELNQTVDLQELYDITARTVRELTGFDRVMVYRYDAEYNGEVVAEAKVAHLNSFLGLHYPASDIPAQARALYEKNWIRLIDDVNYAPSPLLTLPQLTEHTDLDLTYSVLRSVSPIHVEYLQNMGVGASMSISLMRGSRLWGLIACHHYSGPHTPPYATRAAAEFLGSTLSLRLVDRQEQEDTARRLDVQTTLTALTARVLDETSEFADTLVVDGQLFDLIGSDGVAVSIGGRLRTAGSVPPTPVLTALIEHVNGSEDVFVSADLGTDVPGLQPPTDTAAGALGVPLPDGQAIVWLRGETEQSVDWGGDPHNKAIAVAEGDRVRLSPRKSFARWREVVRGRSAPWTAHEIESAIQLRAHTIEGLYRNAQRQLEAAAQLQRQLLPTRISSVEGWDLSALYQGAAGGRVGGDWYDVGTVDRSSFVVVLGDVAGHGLSAAGTMAQLRNALRAYLVEGDAPGQALQRLSTFTSIVLPVLFATCIVARVDSASGEVTIASCGHLPPLLRRAADGSIAPAVLDVNPPVGFRPAQMKETRLTLARGDSLVFVSDGLVERRDQDLDASMADLSDVLTRQDWPVSADQIAAVADPAGDDDTTVIAVTRQA